MKKQKLPGSRATSIEELNTVLDTYFDPSSYERGLAFKPNPSDIIISPYAKCGTTWLQQITHSLRTGGCMDFDEITAVTPWIEVADQVGWNLAAPQVAEPRLYKSHLSWYEVPKGCRYIYSIRHYATAVVSLYRMFEGWFFEPGSIRLDDFVNWRCPRNTADAQGYWHHLHSWWEQRHNKNVLLLCYEDMIRDPVSTIERVASFMDIHLNKELLDIVARQSSREFMLEHRDQFDDKCVRDIGGKSAELPPAIDSSKVTSGVPDNARYMLSQEAEVMLDSIWREQTTSRFGFETYTDLRQSLKDLHQMADSAIE